LTNSELDSASPFAGILLGQPTLDDACAKKAAAELTRD
jgi:hypothetical protein